MSKPDYECKVNYVSFYGKTLNEALEKAMGYLLDNPTQECNGSITWWFDEQSSDYVVSFVAGR